MADAAGRRVCRIAAALLALSVLLGGCGDGDDPAGSTVQRAGDSPYHGTSLDTPWPVPSITLTDTAGDAEVLAEEAAPITLVFFGYTNCPDICQVVMSTIASAVSRLDDDQQKQVDVVFVTTDPARDDPQTMRAWLDRFDPRFEGLTGDLDDIVALAEPLHVFVEKGQQLPSGGYEVEHSTPVLGLQDGGATMVWTQGTSPAQLAGDLEGLLG